MQGQVSYAVLIERKTNEIKEAKPFVLSRVEVFWDSCLWRLLGGEDIRENDLRVQSLFFVFMLLHPPRNLSHSDFSCHLWANYLRISIPWPMLWTYVTKFLFDIFIQVAHRKFQLDMFDDELTVPLKLLLPLHFLYKWMTTIQFTPSSQKNLLLIHSLIWKKKKKNYCILCTKQCFLVVNTVGKKQNFCP